MSTKTLKMMFVVLFCIFTINVLEAQTLLRKELKTETDGFQWYLYHYDKNSNGNWPIAAFDLDGNRLTCTTEHLIEYKPRTEHGPGCFEVWTSKRQHSWREYNMYAYYDSQGNRLIHDCYGAHWYNGFFIVKIKRSGEHDCVKALYDNQMNCIIPESYGFNTITPYVDDNTFGNCILCSESMLLHSNDTECDYFTFSLDGKYYVDFLCADKAKFNAKKKPVSTLNVDLYASSNSSSNSSSSSSSSTSTASTSSSTSSSNTSSSSKKDEGLLYQGDYTEGTLVGQRTGWTMAPAFPQHFGIKIYEDHLEDMGTWKYEGKSMNGCRVYSTTQGWGSSAQTVKYYVDGSFNITAERVVCPGNGPCETYISQFSKGNVAFNINNGGGQNSGGWNGGNSNAGGNSGNIQMSQPKQHKCGVCGGNGRVVKTDGPSFGNTKYCSECGRTVPDNHYHTDCPSCKGKGWW